MRTTVLLIALFAVACGGDSASTSPASASLAGTYQLRTVDANPLPFTYQSGANKAVITGDVLTVADGGTWTEQGAYTLTLNGQTTSQVIADAGTWTRAGTNVTFVSSSSNAAAYSGRFTGSGFNLADQTFTYVFSR